MVDRTLRRILILAGIALILWVLYLLKPVVVPFVAAFLIAYLFSPLVNVLHRIGLARWLSISIVFIGIGIVVTLVMWYLVPLVWQQLMYARDSIPAGIHWINYTFLPWLSDSFNLVPMEIDTDQISSVVMDYVQTNYSADSIQAMLLKLAQSGLNFIQIGGTIVLIPIIAFYFLLDWDRMLDSLRRLIPRPYEKTTLTIVSECHSVLGAFVKGQFLVMVLLGVVYAVGLQLIGLEIGLIIGMIAGLCSIIPYLGFAVGIIAAVIATFFQFGIDWWQLVLVGIVFMVGQAVEGYILQPFLLGDKIGLSPVAVVFAVLAGAQLAGFLGMLIALPVAAVIVVLLRHIREYYEHTPFYGDQAVIIQDASTGSINIETADLDVDIEMKKPQKKPLQAEENSSKIHDPHRKDS
ncbi:MULTISPECIES: chloramphenicol efflux transporter CxpE [Acinetobacter]|jgi:predicted PurR-regulated permease PerM|uniref:PurR-regulated permease PerM n=1 Tax=Acinetobacter lwoffii TaxID=28090 RepID=A0AAW3VB80_ACILW|nr:MULTISPECIES: AI-2E family transporter [Acinetobacter]MBB6362010.1 putative PurR-regulated permease PerM [Acinetobacter lwoffii]MCO8112965.1 AI-2E family transporter [Acinetobacter lwoffii]MDT0198023.1 AI-2E family transporter [Acinetobacter sp. RG5]MDT0229487.1 AI-2E family transporter [Acinetobacter sp. RRD8]MEB6680938.1 AI-2E family transporter [Acinetobacter lwoffii]